MELVSYLVSDCVGSQELSTMYVLKLIQQQMKMCKRIVIPHVLVPVLFNLLSAIVNKPLYEEKKFYRICSRNLRTFFFYFGC